MFRKILMAPFLALIITVPVQAKEIGGVNLPDVLPAGKEELILNGAGLRTNICFGIISSLY
ncbi:MAG: chalcone isomerase family protein [Pseudomonadota bacterium]